MAGRALSALLVHLPRTLDVAGLGLHARPCAVCVRHGGVQVQGGGELLAGDALVARCRLHGPPHLCGRGYEHGQENEREGSEALFPASASVRFFPAPAPSNPAGYTRTCSAGAAVLGSLCCTARKPARADSSSPRCTCSSPYVTSSAACMGCRRRPSASSLEARRAFLTLS